MNATVHHRAESERAAGRLGQSPAAASVRPRILLVSADERLAANLRNVLARMGGTVAFMRTADLAAPPPDPRPPHVIILDLGGRRLDADDIWEDLKATPGMIDAPVLAVVGEEDTGIVSALEGLDDFIVAPWREAELAQRLSRLLRRVNGALSPEAIVLGDLVLDPQSYEVTVGGLRVDLTLKEYELLRHLLTNPGRVFTRSQLLNSIWGYEYLGGTRTVDVHIRRLRAKLGDLGERWIQTVRGVGYVFRPQHTEQPKRQEEVRP